MKTFLIALLAVGSAAAQQPLLFDDIHYYQTDRAAANAFYKTNLAAKPMREQPVNPLTFLDFLEIRPGDATVSISGQGPFEGVKIGDPKRGQRQLVAPQAGQYVYGMLWLALRTSSMEKTLKALAGRRVPIARLAAKLPFEPGARNLAAYGPDYNLVMLVERPDDRGATPFGVDHIQMLCEDLEANVKFYTEVLGAKLLDRKGKSAKLQVAQHVLVLSEPEDLGLKREQVQKKDRGKFFPGPDLFGFLYDEAGLKAATDSAVAKGYRFLMPPTRMNFYEKPTPYTFAILFSPDNFPIELHTEDNRTGPRTMYVK